MIEVIFTIVIPIARRAKEFPNIKTDQYIRDLKRAIARNSANPVARGYDSILFDFSTKESHVRVEQFAGNKIKCFSWKASEPINVIRSLLAMAPAEDKTTKPKMINPTYPSSKMRPTASF